MYMYMYVCMYVYIYICIASLQYGVKEDLRPAHDEISTWTQSIGIPNTYWYVERLALPTNQ